MILVRPGGSFFHTHFGAMCLSCEYQDEHIG